jgi:hypothetical protein
VPEWLPLLQAARYLGVPPWELIEQPDYWMELALTAELAEAEGLAERAKNERWRQQFRGRR